MIVTDGQVTVNRERVMFTYRLHIGHNLCKVAENSLFPLYEMKKLLYNVSDIMRGGGALKCMKCGKETRNTDVFCVECLTVMEKYPVKPGTLAYIPARSESAAARQIRKAKEKTPEEQIKGLHKLVQMLVIGILTLATTLSISIGVLVYVMTEETAVPESRTVPTRRNYSTATTEPTE